MQSRARLLPDEPTRSASPLAPSARRPLQNVTGTNPDETPATPPVRQRDAVVGVAASGAIEMANEQASMLFGYDAEDLVGRDIAILVPAADSRMLGDRLAEYVRDPQHLPISSQQRLTGRRQDGTTFPCDIGLSPVTDEMGNLLILVSVTDVTKGVEDEANRQRRAFEVQRLESLGQLAGGVAHDFNNLLGVILNYTTLVSRRVTDPVISSDVAEIRAAAERGAALTRQLLTFARRDQVNPEALDLNSVIRSVASMLERTLGEHIVLNLALGDEPVIAVCDRTQFEQIVLNLAINARDAMADGGLLRIAAHQSLDAAGRGHCILTVTDTGHGMPPDVIARAFEPFFTTKPSGRGTGLGLATVYGIVHQNGGTVDIDSAPDLGTTVTVRLRAGAGAGQSAPSSSTSAIGGTERVLLVEDKERLRVVTARMLCDRGYDVVTAVDGVDALEILDADEDGFALVVTDVAMPRMRGDELGARIRERWSDLPVLYLTGYDSGSGPLAGRVLAKPVSEGDLLLAMREALDA